MVGRLRAWEGRQALQDPLPDAAAFPSRVACGGSAMDPAALPGRRCMSALVTNHTGLCYARVFVIYVMYIRTAYVIPSSALHCTSTCVHVYHAQ